MSAYHENPESLLHEGIYESAHEHEHENEASEMAFFNHLAAMADRGGRSQALRRIAVAAARAALKARPVRYAGVEGELGEYEGLLEISEQEILEAAESQEAQAEAAMQMEHLGHAAAEAQNEDEAAEQFFPLIGLAAKLALPLIKKAGIGLLKSGAKSLLKGGVKSFVRGQAKGMLKSGVNALKNQARSAVQQRARALMRRVPQTLQRTAPQVSRGISNVTRVLHRNPVTRPLIHAVPRIARSTMADIARRAAQGQPVTPQTAQQVLAKNVASALSDPRRLVRTYQRSLAADRAFHKHGVPAPLNPATAGVASPSGGYSAPGGGRRACRCQCTCG